MRVSFLDMSVVDLRLGAFFLAVLIYGVFGSPTPDMPGVIEAVIAGLLVVSVGVRNLGKLFQFRGNGDVPDYYLAGRFLLFWGLICGLAVGAVQGNAVSHIVRDVIPFLFFLLPLFVRDLFARERSYAVFVGGACFVGVLFALRSLVDLSSLSFVGLAQIGAIATSAEGELLYLANMPTVLFAALALSGFAGQNLVRSLRVPVLVRAGLYAALALLPLLALAVSLQRASLGLYVLAIGMLLMGALYSRPYRGWRVIFPLGALVAIAFPAVILFFDVVLAKTVAVGFNSRFEEIGAVWRSLSMNPISIVFGKGLGATFLSPAVGDLEVNFTHSLLSTMLLKTGLCGVALSLIYLAGLARLAVAALFKNSVLVMAIFMPVLIDVFLYASFKTFDFGLVLCLIPVILTRNVAQLYVGPVVTRDESGCKPEREYIKE